MTSNIPTEKRAWSWRIFIIVLLIGLAGALATALGVIYLLPGAVAQLGEQAQPLPPTGVIVLATTVQLMVLLTVAAVLGLLLAPRINHEATPVLRDGLHDNRLWLGLGSGVVAGLLMLAAHQLIFMPITGIPVNLAADMPWPLGLASAFLYGGLAEEILMRLGLTTLLLWLGSFLGRDATGRPTLAVFWVVNVIVAVLFGLGHLPGAIALQGVELSAIVVVQALVLNAVSLLFGWWYWTRGLETAMAAHVGVHVGYTLLALILL